MTFTNILIGLLVVAIVLVAADAVRRMWKDRGSIRIKIDPRFSDLPDGGNPELPRGGARPAGEVAPEQMPLDNMEPPLVMETDDEEPVVPQPAQPVSQIKTRAPSAAETTSQQPTPQSQQPAPQPEPVAEPAAPATDAPAEPAPILDVIVVHLLFPAGVAGQALLQSLLDQGLRYGEMKIFHRHEEGKLLFSLANAHEPGYFNIDTMEKEELRAVSFFMKLPGPPEALRAFNQMIACAEKLAQDHQGDLRDESRNPLTQQMKVHLREKVQEFERRMRVPNAR